MCVHTTLHVLARVLLLNLVPVGSLTLYLDYLEAVVSGYPILVIRVMIRVYIPGRISNRTKFGTRNVRISNLVTGLPPTAGQFSVKICTRVLNLVLLLQL